MRACVRSSTVYDTSKSAVVSASSVTGLPALTHQCLDVPSVYMCLVVILYLPVLRNGLDGHLLVTTALPMRLAVDRAVASVTAVTDSFPRANRTDLSGKSAGFHAPRRSVAHPPPRG